jgi:hypothetical protein
MNELIHLYDSPMKFWAMPTDLFNKWRIKNDLPILFNYFQSKLPLFDEWLKDCKFSIDEIIEYPKTGELFEKGNTKYLMKYTELSNDKIHLDIIDLEEKNRICKNDDERIKINSMIEFIPYFKWIEKQKNVENLIETFSYLSHDNIDNIILSRALLFKDFPVLKLGGVTLNKHIFIGNRNLDFIDLDYLQIKEDWHGSMATNIAYSSLRYVNISNAILHYWTLNECDIEELKIEKSEIQNFNFIESEIFRISLKDSKILNLKFDSNDIRGLEFSNCDINNISYIAKKDNLFERDFYNLRQIRIAFQKQGKRHESQEFYFKERKYETKSQKNLFKKYLYKFEELICGYFIRPERVIFSSLILIIIFAILHFILGKPPLYRSYIDSIYFSVTTFTTLGYGDIAPQSIVMKIICSMEAMLGAIFIGLFLFCLGNKQMIS